MLNYGDTLIDIGANIGIISLLSVPFVSSKGRIIAVEPQKECCELLRESILQQQLANITVCQVALSDHDGTAYLEFLDHTNLGMTSISTERNHNLNRRTVRMRNGSEFLESSQITGEYVIKIDVEVHEEKLVQGIRPYLERHPAKGIIFEVNSHKYDGLDFFRNSAYLTFLELGYVVLGIHKSFFRMKVCKVEETTDVSRITDFIAVRNDQISRFSQWLVKKLT